MRFFGACINFDIGSCASLESTTELRKANSVSRDGNARPGSKNIKKIGLYSLSLYILY